MKVTFSRMLQDEDGKEILIFLNGENCGHIYKEPEMDQWAVTMYEGPNDKLLYDEFVDMGEKQLKEIKNRIVDKINKLYD